MSASPFRTTSGPFVEVPAPVVPASSSEAKKDLEDVPFDADIHEFPSAEEQEVSPEPTPPKTRRHGLFNRLFAGRSERRLREEMLEAELRDLRASYAGLLHSTEDIREQIVQNKEDRENFNNALSPFPSAAAGIESLQTRQEEASEILTSIRDRVTLTGDREDSLYTTMDSVHGGVGKLQSQVGAVNVGVEVVTQTVFGIVEEQGEVKENLSNFDEKVERRFKEAALTAQANAERVEQSGDEVLQVLRQVERTSQRGLWIFATVLAVLFIALICFSAKMSQLTSEVIEEPAAAEVSAEVVATPAEDSLVAAEPVAQVLNDDFEF